MFPTKPEELVRAAKIRHKTSAKVTPAVLFAEAISVKYEKRKQCQCVLWGNRRSVSGPIPALQLIKEE